MLAELFKKAIARIQEKIYDYKTIRLEPSEWVEKNIYLTRAESNYSGLFSYDRSPYSKEIIDCLSPNSNVQQVGIMKCAQSGFTAGVVANGLAYTIAENPTNVMFLSGSEKLVQDTIRDRLDPIIQNSGLQHFIQPNVNKKKNQKSGDTDFKKEFAGGSLTAVTYIPSKLRFYTAQLILADEFDDAPKSDKKEGSIRTLLENRTTSYGDSQKLIYITTPSVKGVSNIEDVYEEGDKRKWNWECPHCKEYIPIEWTVKREDGTFGGIKYELDENRKLIESSVHYECQLCSGTIEYKQKYDLNLSGKWIPTCEPEHPSKRSYQFNALCLPPAYTSWVKLVSEWIKANPHGEPINESLLKAFMNTRLGQLWTDLGTTPNTTELMRNVRDYRIGKIPDVRSIDDGNGKIVLITLSCDLGGVMETNNEDVRLDWDIVAHTGNGVTYRIDHGSIGTFKRSRKKTTKDKENESERTKFTYAHGYPTSVWPYLKQIIDENYIGESGDVHNIDMVVIDTGHFTKLAYDFIRQEENPFIVGIKGYGEEEYRKLNKDTPAIKRSQELLGKLYILQVNQLKDILAANMKLKMGLDGYQPSGFMNFPTPEYRKYDKRNYFDHYEGEHRVEDKNSDGTVVGFAWKKKNSSVENHFFDTAVYTLAAKEIYIDIIRRTSPQNAKLTWEDYAALINQEY